MRVGIVGCGGIALGYAALLNKNGYEQQLWSPSGASALALENERISVTGKLEMTFDPVFASSVEQLMQMADTVIIAVPGYGHRKVIDAIVPFARNRQTFIVSAQLSMSALYLSEQLAEGGIDCDVIAWATTVIMSRRSGPTSIQVGGIRKQLEAAILPSKSGERAMNLCRDLFGDRFTIADDIFAIALSNLNPPIHLASALCNFTRIEKGEYWANYDGITPSVARMIEELDLERLAVAQAFGVKVRTVQDHYRLTFGFAEGLTLAEMAASVHAQRNGPPGPTSIDTRFITEDVPFGIVPIIALAKTYNVPVPLHTAGVTIANALYGRDFAAENDILPFVKMLDNKAGQLNGRESMSCA